MYQRYVMRLKYKILVYCLASVSISVSSVGLCSAVFQRLDRIQNIYTLKVLNNLARTSLITNPLLLAPRANNTAYILSSPPKSFL
jgi:hypothetical protein